MNNLDERITETLRLGWIYLFWEIVNIAFLISTGYVANKHINAGEDGTYYYVIFAFFVLMVCYNAVLLKRTYDKHCDLLIEKKKKKKRR